MGDTAVLSEEGIDLEASNSHSSCHSNGSNCDSTKLSNSEADGSKTLKSEILQSVNLCVKDEYEDQENENIATENEPVVCNTTMPNKLNCEIGMGLELDVSNKDVFDKTKKREMYCSTPNVTKTSQEALTNQSPDLDAPDFGLVSPLNVKSSKGKQHLKRKCISLHPIEEIDEDGSNDAMFEKKIKTDETELIHMTSTCVEAGTSSTIPCFEVPAKSLLKKWQPSCLSRNASTTSFIVLDECGDTEVDNSIHIQEYDSSKVDDFEIACQSLTEELMKSSSNIETLEKYHSQVQLENQMDDEKFDEILKELTMHVDLDDNTCLSVKSMDESILSDTDKTCHVLKAIENSDDTLVSDAGHKEAFDNTVSPSEKNTTVVDAKNHFADSGNGDDLSVGKSNEQLENTTEVHKSNDAKATLELTSSKEKPSASDGDEILDIDEEDFLLEENVNTKAKHYEFFEFVSTDPKENEDNYNPEWQKLGRLTSDEERYKAVRDRWRSLVPPDPNRNLTYRQWRAKNNKPPIKLSPLNNNHRLMDNSEKNQLCTAVFDNKIKRTVQELEDSRMNIYRQRNREFEELGHVQDEEQMRATMRGFNYREIAQLHSNHLNQCRTVKNQYDQELKRIQEITEGKIRILREAKEEILLFQKFYKGVGARNDNEMYLTDIQVQELMETEEMLEQYRIYYK